MVFDEGKYNSHAFKQLNCNVEFARKGIALYIFCYFFPPFQKNYPSKVGVCFSFSSSNVRVLCDHHNILLPSPSFSAHAIIAKKEGIKQEEEGEETQVTGSQGHCGQRPDPKNINQKKTRTIFVLGRNGCCWMLGHLALWPETGF